MAVRGFHFAVFFLLVIDIFGQLTDSYFVKDIGLKSKGFSKIRKIHKSNNGLLWLAGQDGLHCTDGIAITSYLTSSKPVHRISEIDIWDICEDKALNALYVLSSSGTIDIIDTRTGIVMYKIKIGAFLQDNWYMSLTKVGNQLWISSYKGIFIYDLATNTSEHLNLQNETGNEQTLCSKITLHSKDSVWFHIAGKGLFLFSTTQKKKLLTVSNAQLATTSTTLFTVNDISIQPNGMVFLATNQGLRSITFQNNKTAVVNMQPSANKTIDLQPVFSLQKTNSSIIISSTQLYELNYSKKQLHTLTCATVTAENSALNNIIATCYDSNEGLCWFFSNQKLQVLKLMPYFAKAYGGAGDNIKKRFSDVYSVHPKKNDIYVGCAGGLLKQDANGNASVVDNVTEYYYQFTVDSTMDVVSSGKGLKILKANQIYPIGKLLTEWQQYSGVMINSAVKIAQFEWLIGTEDFNGVLVWNTKNKTVKKIAQSKNKEQQLSNVVNNVYYDGKNIFILSDKIIAVLNQKYEIVKKISFKKQNSADSAATYFAMCKQAGYYYFAIYGTGVIRTDSMFAPLSYFSEENGLCNNGVYNIFPVADSQLYVTTNNGISIINTSNGSIKNIYTEDGLHSNQFEEAASKYNGGLIYAGGANGYTVINPVLLQRNNQKPILFFKQISFQTETGVIDTANISITKIIVPNNVLQTTVNLSAVSWQNPQRTTFAWRLSEQNTDWINLNTQNFITLIGLSPGTYHLQVKAANEEGVWSEPKELILIFLPKWYQTWWFYTLIVLAVAAILYALYRYRINQIKKQHQIRKNIATDLHDDLGSTLNSVKVFTNLAISGVKQEESLQQVKDNLTEATMSLRDMIWVLDDSLDTVDELVTRLKQFAIPITAASNMQFVINANSDVNSRTLTKEEKRNLFLICKEAINNSIKYSGAAQVTVDIVPAGKKIQITVADDGKGFDEATVKKGYGLKNMQYRAGQIKYTTSLHSSENSGTQIKIVPS